MEIVCFDLKSNPTDNVQSIFMLYLGRQTDETKNYQTSQAAWANRNWENVLPAGIGQGADEDDWKTTFLSTLQGGLFSVL